MDDNVRFEGAITAASKGNLTYGQYPLDMATAVSFASIRNPLGGALYDFHTNSCSKTTYAVVMLLATALGKKGYAVGPAREIAFKAHTFCRDHHCQKCHGNGVTGTAQRECPSCDGSGDRPLPGERDVKLGVAMIEEAIHLLDRQIARLMKDAVSENNLVGNSVHLPMKDIQSDHGFNHDSRTPARSSGG